jgi:E3 ubiquitin-protein ligase TRAF7
MGADVFVCFTSDGSTQVWDVSNWEPLGTLDGHRGTVYDLTVLETPGQTKLFSASYDKTIRVWNVEHMRCVQTLTRHEGSVVCLGISRGRLFSGSVDGTVKFWQ